MSIFKNLAGMTFARLTVVSRADVKGPVRWLCRCECGGEKVILAKQLLNSGTRSCGCLYTDHGMARTRLYRIWQGVKERCFNPNRDEFKHYGGRGITVCREWTEDFQAFREWSEANGYAADLTLDRFPDNDGHYEPGNCRWVPMLEQANNRRGNRILTFRGETKTLSEFARQVGINRATLSGRLRANWTVDDALTTTPRDWGR